MKTLLDPGVLDERIEEIEKRISEIVLFQPRAVKEVARAITRMQSPFRDNKKPIGSFLFVGPSGVGKTETVRALASVLFDDEKAITRVDCSDYYDRHTVARIVGSPPGYIGYQDPTPFEQGRMERYAVYRAKTLLQRDPEVKERIKEIEDEITELRAQGMSLSDEASNSSARSTISAIKQEIQTLEDRLGMLIKLWAKERGIPFCSLVLFDELEKADPALWKIILTVLEEGEIQLSDRSKTVFMDSMVFMTSNVDSVHMERYAAGVDAIGFSSSSREESNENAIYESVRGAIKKMFPAELRGRIQKIVMFRSFTESQLRVITRRHISRLLQEIVTSQFPLEVIVDEHAKEFLFTQACSRPEEGARHVVKKIDSHLRYPIEALIIARKVAPAERVLVTVSHTEPYRLVFFKDDSVVAMQNRELFLKIERSLKKEKQ